MNIESEKTAIELFNEIKVTHGINHLPNDVIDEKAREQWLSKHDNIPTIEEIDEVIDDYRRSQK